jgi:hypothetical protein
MTIVSMTLTTSRALAHEMKDVVQHAAHVATIEERATEHE